MEQQDVRFPWQKLLLDALLELDREKLRARVADAEMAIFERLRAIARGAEHHGEIQAIEDALATLRVLKKDNDHHATQ